MRTATADIKELVVTGAISRPKLSGHSRLGETGTSNLEYDVAVTNLEPLAKRFNRPFAGSAHVVGQATAQHRTLTLAGTLGANRLRYSTNVDALTANSKYTVEVPNFRFRTGAHPGRHVGHVRHDRRVKISRA